jgi:tetratricopeptide (TPR) repeat protein
MMGRRKETVAEQTQTRGEHKEYWMGDTIQVLEQKLAALAARPEPNLCRIDLLNDLALALYRIDLDRSYQVGLEAERLLADVPYPQGQAACFRNLASALAGKGDFQQALEYGKSGLALAEQFGLKEIVRSIVGVLGWAYSHLGDRGVALEYYRRQYQVALELDDKAGQAMALSNMSVVFGSSGDRHAAIEALQEALTLYRVLGDDNGQVMTLNNLAMAYRLLGDCVQAMTCGQEALELARARDIQFYQPYVLDTIGSIHVTQEAYDQATAYFQEGISTAQALGRKDIQATCILNLGRMYVRRKQFDLGREQLLQALPLFEEKDGLFECHQLLAEVYEARGDLREALYHYKRFCEIKDKVFRAESDQRIKNLQIIHQTQAARREAETYRLKNVELEEALAQIRQLSGLLPICANCRKIRDDAGYWQDVAVYIRDHSEAKFSYGICPDCMKELYPEYGNEGQADA